MTIDGQRDASTACTYSGIRLEACICLTCKPPDSFESKFQVNKRDVRAVIDLIAGSIDCHPSLLPTDGDSDDDSHSRLVLMKSIREHLMAIAVKIACWGTPCERAHSMAEWRRARDRLSESARRRLELALAAEDEALTEALIDAM